MDKTIWTELLYTEEELSSQSANLHGALPMYMDVAIFLMFLSNEKGIIDLMCYVWFTSSNIVFCASVYTRQVRWARVMSSLRKDECWNQRRNWCYYTTINRKECTGFQLSVVKPKPNQLLTNYTIQPISNCSKTKTKTKAKTNVIVWLLLTLNWKPL